MDISSKNFVNIYTEKKEIIQCNGKLTVEGDDSISFSEGVLGNAAVSTVVLGGYIHDGQTQLVFFLFTNIYILTVFNLYFLNGLLT